METTVSTTPPATAAPPVVTPPAVAPPDNAAEVAALKQELAEQKEATKFWYAKQEQRPAPAAAAAPEPEEEVDLLDLLSTQGTKGFDAFMKKRGYVSKADVDQAVNSKAAQLSAEADLISQHPDLRNKESDFFKATAQAYGELKREGVPEALAMRLAAERAELQGFKSGKVKTPIQKAADDKSEKEATRLARIKAQGADRGSRAAEANEEDDEMTPAELHICEAMGITPEAYKARAQAGVRMGGVGGKK